MDEPGDSAAYAACTTSGIPGAPSILYYLCPNPTVYDTAAWVTDTFPDTTISAGTWWFFFWAKADTYYYDPLGEKLYHFMAVKVWRYRGTGPDSLLFLEIDDPSDVASHVKQYWDLFTVEANNIGSITFNAGDRLWIEVWTYRDATLNDPVEVRFGYNSPPDTLRSYFEMP